LSDVWYVAQVVVSGITPGATYALMALGFVLVYKATGVVNFAHGEAVMVGAYAGLILHSELHLPYVPAFLLTLVVAFLLGLAVELIVYRPLIRAPAVSVILASLALGQIMRSAVRLARGDDMRVFPPVLSTRPLAFGEVVITPLSLGVIALSLLFMAVLAVFFRWFRLGKAMRAVSENQLAASLMGISVPAVFSWTWGLSSLLAGASGILIAPLVMISPEMGFVAFKGFVAAILGGFTSIPGTILGGFVMGILENLAGVFVSTAYKDVISFVFMIAVLAVRPAGLLSATHIKKV
jgi:branched-chain amino acid transport system permease protein